MRRGVVVGAIAVAPLACNAILGNEDGVYVPPPAGDAAAGDALAEDAPSDVGPRGDAPVGVDAGDSGPVPTVVARGLNAPNGVAIASDDLYVTVSGPTDAGDPAAEQGVFSCKVSGALPCDVARVALDQPSPSALTVDGNSVYWLVPNAIRACRRGNDCATAPVTITPLQFPASGLAVDAAGGALYWTISGSGQVLRCAIGSCAPAIVATGLVQPSPIALSGDTLAWGDLGTGANDANIAVCSASNCAPKFYAPGSTPDALALDATGITWAHAGSIAGNDGTVQRYALPPTTVVDVALAQRHPTALATYAGDAYWVTGDGSVMRALLGQPAETMAKGQATPVAIAVDGTYVYWVNRGTPGARDGQVLRLAR